MILHTNIATPDLTYCFDVLVATGESLLLNIRKLLVMALKCITGIGTLQNVKFNMCILDAFNICFQLLNRI
jgi:hypothetical protein